MAAQREEKRGNSRSPLYTPKAVAAQKKVTVIRDVDGAYRAVPRKPKDEEAQNHE